MAVLIVVNQVRDWPGESRGAQLVGAREYLTASAYSRLRRCHVFNLCESYRYQQMGYYVSLLAAARGHHPLPDIQTIQAVKSRTTLRFAADDLEELIQRSLKPLRSRYFQLSVYFGRNPAKRYDKLAKALFNTYPVPLLRAAFVCRRGRWRLDAVRVVPLGEVPRSHREFLAEVMGEHFARRVRPRRTPAPSYDLAILVNPQEENPPSDERALRRFERAARRLDFGVERIGRNDYGRIAEFDGLLIRETTRVDHHTFRFAQRAAAEGLIVIDDPESIIRCTNKVYLAELAQRLELPGPRTMIIHRGNVEHVATELGLPCVLKQPDSAFSQGVVKVDDESALHATLEDLLARSDLIVGQSFVPTDFDWRIGVLDNRPLYACRYYMAHRHWQIIKRHNGGRQIAGRYETVPVEQAPPRAIRLALKAAAPIGDGLYGVDIKQAGRRFFLIEVNDNPSIEAGVEDAWLGDELYGRILSVMRARIDASKR
jgi:glutathione synthase/RimK-type ligase-like ATP-grasp enzyme